MEEGRKLQGRVARSQSPATGCLVIFALPFMAAGVCMILAGAGVFHVKSTGEAPLWIFYAMGPVFFFSGAAIAWAGATGWSKRNRAKRLRRDNPHQPWLADFRWNSRMAKDDNLSYAVGSFGGGMFIALFMLPFNWWAFVSNHTHVLVVAVTALFDLLTLGILAQGFYYLGRVLKYGGSTLRWRRFPAFLGEDFEADFRTFADVRPLKKMTMTLRCIRERLEQEKPSDTGPRAVPYEVWAETRVLEPAVREHPVSFKLPADDEMSTKLSGYPVIYWELEVTAEAPGIDYGAKFLVPVYARTNGRESHREKA